MAEIKNSGQIEALLGKILVTAENSQKTGYQLMSERKAKKALRRKAVAERLAQSLAPEDPRLKMAKIQAGRAIETAAALKQRVTRLKKKPKLGKNDWMVSGNVHYDDGRTATGLIVQVFDKDLKFDDLLGKTTTDDFGDFYIVYDTCRFDDEWGNKQPDLYIQISDNAGNILAKNTEPLRVNAGHTEYFQVVIASRKIKRTPVG